MATEVSDDQQSDPASFLRDGPLMNGVVRLVTAVSGMGSLAFAGYHALNSPQALITAAFLVAGVVLLVLALASEPTSPPVS